MVEFAWIEIRNPHGALSCGGDLVEGLARKRADAPAAQPGNGGLIQPSPLSEGCLGLPVLIKIFGERHALNMHSQHN